MKFYDDDVAIVAYSAVAPGCEDEAELFQSLLEGRCLIRDLTTDEAENPLQVRFHFSKDKKTPDATYCKYGTKISLKKIAEWAERNDLNTETSTTLEIVLHELFRRLEDRHPELFDVESSECILGVSTGETDPVRIGQRRLYDRIKDELNLNEGEKKRIEQFYSTFAKHPARKNYLRKDLFSPLMCQSLRERYNLSGPSSFIDAACASSLAALMLAVRRIRDGERDLVISGGIDVSTVLLTLFAFSKLQVMSDKIMNPFDRSADGMNQGEGAAIFALMRLSRAKAKGYPVLGVIRNCDGSSDGALGGMVEPTEYGQNLAYDRAYQEVPLAPLTYLECHGTGTKLGDKTELQSTAKFFHPLPPIGSIKANVGHTIAAAGAMSLVKALKIIEHRMIPKMPNFRKIEKKYPHVIHRDNFPIPADQDVRIGISSFGFGGANYHMVLDSYNGEDFHPTQRQPRRDFKFLLNGVAEVDLNFVYELLSTSRFKIPPVALPYADPAILGGMIAVEKLMTGLGVRLSQKQKEKIGVISNSNSYLARLSDSYERIGFLELYRRLDENKQTDELLKKYMPNDLTVTEDTFMWALNNLIAGRITKDFDLKGPNFNLACEKASLGASLSHARTLLKCESGAYIILSMDEDTIPNEFRLARTKVRALLVSDLEYSLAAELPIDMEIKNIQHTPARGIHAHA